MPELKLCILVAFIAIASVGGTSDSGSFQNTLLTPIKASIEPCDDFYEYACGNWRNLNLNLSDSHLVPDSLDVAKQEVNDRLIELLSADIGSESDTASSKAKRFYSSCLNSKEDEGVAKLIATINSISDWPILNSDWKEDNFNWLKVASKLRLYGIRAVLNEAVGPHWKDSSAQLVYFVSPKFDFVHKDDLLGTSRNSEEFVFFYKRYIKLLMLKLGLRIRKAKQVANEIVAFETKLAELIPNEEEIVPPEPISIESLSAKIPQIDWNKYLSGVLEHPINSSNFQVIIHEEYYRKLASLISRTERRTFADYLLFKFMFHFKVAAEDKHTAQQCLQDVTKRMGTIGEMYVRRYFPLENRRNVAHIVENVQTAFREAVNTSSWLDTPTKESALDKLRSMSTIIGYPDHILDRQDGADDLANLEIKADDYYSNCLNMALFETKQEHRQLYAGPQPWTPSAVDTNAFYRITKNAIFIPAGILLAPIFQNPNPNFHKYAVLGSIVGHELTHGFDFEGRNYNSKGSLENWWSTRSLIGYYSHMECVLSQHNNFSSAQPRGSRSGIGSISENVADNGGVRLAYRAYETWLRSNSGNKQAVKEELPGVNLTSNQLFFLSYAQFWCSSIQKGQEGSHASNKYRVIGSLSNFPYFAEAFNCPLGSNMNPIRKCELW